LFLLVFPVYDLRNRMVEEFVESKRERAPPRKKAAKKTRAPAEIAAARAAKRADEMEAAAYETVGSEHAAEQEEDDSAAEPDHARPNPPSTGTSVVPSISEEHASEESQE
jgi:hypothetical protein